MRLVRNESMSIQTVLHLDLDVPSYQARNPFRQALVSLRLMGMESDM
jgi:hypothetical protein